MILRPASGCGNKKDNWLPVTFYFFCKQKQKTRSLSKSLCFFNGIQCIRRIGGWANFRPGCYCDGIRFEKYADSQKDAVSPFFPDTLYILLIPSAAGGNLSWKKTNARCNCSSLLLFLRFSIFIFIFVTRIIFLNTIIIVLGGGGFKSPRNLPLQLSEFR